MIKFALRLLTIVLLGVSLPPAARGTMCDVTVQPSTIAVSVGENFTISCSFSCYGGKYQTASWFTDDSMPLFSITENPDLPQCDPDNTSITTGIRELTLFASNEMRHIQSIECRVAYMDNECSSSTTLEIIDPCQVEKTLDVVIGELVSVNCTIPCDLQHEEYGWYVSPKCNRSVVLDLLPEETNVTLPTESQHCDNANVSDVTYGLDILITNKSLSIGTIVCLVPQSNSDQDESSPEHVCIISASFNVVESPSPTSTPGLTTGTTEHVLLPTSTTEVPPMESPTEIMVNRTDSSCQLISNFKLVALFIAVTFTFIHNLH